MNNNIIGYSERGVMNAILYSIGNDNSKLTDLLRILTSNISLTILDTEFKIYIEHSLSQFGTPDTVIIADGIVYFIEYKVSAFRKWSLTQEYKLYKNKCSSSVYSQIQLKKLLFDNRKSIFDDIGVYDEMFSRHRKIGNNPVVNKLAEKIQNCITAKYIAVVPSTEEKNEKSEFSYCHFISWELLRGIYNDENIEAVFQYNKNQIY